MITTMILVVALTVSPSQTQTFEIRDSYDTKELCESAMDRHIDSIAAQSILNGVDAYIVAASCNPNNKPE